MLRDGALAHHGACHVHRSAPRCVSFPPCSPCCSSPEPEPPGRVQTSPLAATKLLCGTVHHVARGTQISGAVSSSGWWEDVQGPVTECA